MKKIVVLFLTLAFLTALYTNDATAVSSEAHNFDCNEAQCSYSVSELTDTDDLNEGGQRNLWCALFGHKVTHGTLTVLGAVMIDFEQCYRNYVIQGFCDRCGELSTREVSETGNHELITQNSNIYCKYGCGFIVSPAK